MEGHQTVGLEAGIGAHQRDEAANQQAGADEQHERERDLRDDEPAQGAMMLSPRPGPPRRLGEVFAQIRLSRAQRRDEPERDARQQHTPATNARTNQLRCTVSARGSAAAA